MILLAEDNADVVQSLRVAMEEVRINPSTIITAGTHGEVQESFRVWGVRIRIVLLDSVLGMPEWKAKFKVNSLSLIPFFKQASYHGPIIAIPGYLGHGEEMIRAGCSCSLDKLLPETVASYVRKLIPN